MTDAQRKELLEGLNEDLAAEYQAVIFYLLGAQLMTGPNRPELKQLFEGEIQDEIGHAQFLASKIVALGGRPTTEPRPVELGDSNRDRIELALEAETETIGRYERRARQASEAGEVGLQVRLEDLVADETDHKEEMELILRDYLD